MPRPKTLSLILAVDGDGICASQTPGGAGSLTLNGVLTGSVTSGVYNSTTAQQIGITSAGNDSGRTYTVTGKGYDSNGFYSESVSEDVTGPNAGTVESTYYYVEITDISIDGAAAGANTVGTVDEAVTPIYPTNAWSLYNVGLQVDITGTINTTVQYTLQDVQDTSIALSWINATDLTTITADADKALSANVTGVRMVVNSGSDGGIAKLSITQAG